MPNLNTQYSLLVASEDASITGHSNVISLIPERIDLAAIDLGDTGGILLDVVIDNIYNSNNIGRWEYAYQKSIKSVDVSGPTTGNVFTIRLTFLDDTYVEDTFVVDVDKNYVYTQSTPATTWTITHNLGKFACINLVDADGYQILGDIHHDSINQITVSFVEAVSGKAYIN